MPDVSSATLLAKQAAQLLPAPPRAGDPALYLAWDELVWSTAHALAELHASELEDFPRDESPLLPCASVSWETLLALAASTLPSPRTRPTSTDKQRCRRAGSHGRAPARRGVACR